MIFVECKPDVVLVKTLTSLPKRHVIHAGNNIGVYRQLELNDFDHICKGMVDEDPDSIPTINDDIWSLTENLSNYKLKVMTDNRGNSLIRLDPDIEGWILRVARLEHIDVQGRYNLPNNPRSLHRVITYRLDKWERLINDLKNTEHLKILSEKLSIS